jgi:site-specific DNA-methyltransferase (adenine-specific)
LEVTIKEGDCLIEMPKMSESSVDAIVSDPPYGLSFMGRDWDHGVPSVAFWVAALRILKPGAHMLAFGGTRTFHRLTVAIEDAGFEIRDCLGWIYGSGFPKSLDISKAIDKAAGAERQILGYDIEKAAKQTKSIATAAYGDFSGNSGKITAPASPEAAIAEGFNFVGIEIDPHYCEIAAARLSKALEEIQK